MNTSPTLFAQLIEILNEEELIRLQRRSTMQNKILLATILSNVLEERDRDAREDKSVQRAEH
jgi:hypothetical protein